VFGTNVRIKSAILLLLFVKDVACLIRIIKVLEVA